MSARDLLYGRQGGRVVKTGATVTTAPCDLCARPVLATMAPMIGTIDRVTAEDGMLSEVEAEQYVADEVRAALGMTVAEFRRLAAAGSLPSHAAVAHLVLLAACSGAAGAVNVAWGVGHDGRTGSCHRCGSTQPTSKATT